MVSLNCSKWGINCPVKSTLLSSTNQRWSDTKIHGTKDGKWSIWMISTPSASIRFAGSENVVNSLWRGIGFFGLLISQLPVSQAYQAKYLISTIVSNFLFAWFSDFVRVVESMKTKLSSELNRIALMKISESNNSKKGPSTGETRTRSKTVRMHTFVCSISVVPGDDLGP